MMCLEVLKAECLKQEHVGCDQNAAAVRPTDREGDR